MLKLVILLGLCAVLTYGASVDRNNTGVKIPSRQVRDADDEVKLDDGEVDALLRADSAGSFQGGKGSPTSSGQTTSSEEEHFGNAKPTWSAPRQRRAASNSSAPGSLSRPSRAASNSSAPGSLSRPSRAASNSTIPGSLSRPARASADTTSAPSSSSSTTPPKRPARQAPKSPNHQQIKQQPAPGAHRNVQSSIQAPARSPVVRPARAVTNSTISTTSKPSSTSTTVVNSTSINAKPPSGANGSRPPLPGTLGSSVGISTLGLTSNANGRHQAISSGRSKRQTQDDDGEADDEFY